MNCFDDTPNNTMRLALFLTLVDKGTCVCVEFVEHEDVFLKRINNATDILNLCEKGTAKLKHHPRIVNVRTGVVCKHPALKVTCV